MDRKKVIKGLENCSTTDGNCQWAEHPDCPYLEDCKAEKYSALDRDALALLKEQEEKTGEWIYKHDNIWYCSRCGEIIYSETDDDLEIHHVYCSRCGAKMKQGGR